VVDLAAERLTRTIGTSFEAQGLALTPDGKTLYVGSRAGGTLAAIDVATATPTDLPSGEWHFGLTISPDGRWLLAPGHYSRSLTVVDVGEQRVARELRVDPLGEGAFNLPHYAVIAPDGRYAYLPFQGRSMARITLGTWAVEYFPLAIGAHQHGVAISPDGRRLYVVNVTQHDSLSEIDTTDFRELRRFPVTGAHERVLLSPDGTTAFLSGGYEQGGHDDLTVIDLPSGQVTTIPSGGARPVGLALVPRAA
jgi:DNA-binding beta-propeller fold protein YncE